ncbi:MAG: hypothetical protein AB1486_23910 [Planctomycetota bacterium]
MRHTLVQDLSAPIHKALLEEWPALPVFFCHWRFLADVGKDLLGEHYQRLPRAFPLT